MDVCFLILSLDNNSNALKNTLWSIRQHCYERQSVCVVPKNTIKEDINNMNLLCNTYKGGETITSLVNTGMNKIKSDWSFIVFSGGKIPSFLEQKWATFCKSEKDVLFPLTIDKFDFVEGCFNGVLINNSFFKEVGDFPSNKIEKNGFNDFEFSKLLWASEALSKGAIFKGILGMRVI